MKTLLYGLAGLAVLLVAAVLLGPRFIDWTAYKETVAARLADATGRDVAIAGRVDVNVLPNPTLTLNGLRIANAPGGRARYFLRAGALRLEVAWLPLLQGSIRLDAVDLVEPRLVLESGGPKGPNWRGLNPGDLPLGLSVAALEVVDGRLVHRNLDSGARRALKNIDAHVAAATPAGPFEGAGRFTARGARLTFDGRLGRLAGTGTVAYRLNLGLAESEASASVSGGLQRRAGRVESATASVSLRGKTLAGVLERFGVPAAPALDRGFSAEAEVAVNGRRLRAKSLTLALGEADISGGATLRFGDPLGLTARLSTQRLGLDRFRGSGETLPIPWTRGAWRWLAELSAVEGRVSLDVAGLTYRGQLMRRTRLDVVLTGAGVRIAKASALIPGSGTVSARGRIALHEGTPVFDGHAAVSASNLRRTLRWLDLEPEAVGPGRLRRLDLAADIRAAPGRVTLTNLSGQVDTTKLEGGVAIALRGRPGFGIGLHIPTLRLGGYLGPLAARPLDQVMAVFGRFDANLDLRVDHLVYRGREFGEVHLKGSLSRGTLTIATGRVGQLGGGSLRLDGSVANLDGANPRVDLTFNLSVDEPARFAAFAGLGAVVPPQAGTMTLGGTLTGAPRRLTVDLTLDALNGLATARGLLQPAAAPPRFQGTLKLVHGDLTALARRMPGAPRLPPVLSRVDLSGEATLTPGKLTLHKLAGTLGPMDVSGSLSADWRGERPVLDARLRTPRLPLGKLVGGAWTAGGGEVATQWLRGYRAELDVTAGSAPLGGGIAVTDARLAGRVDDGRLVLARFAGGLAGGRITLAGELRGGSTPALALQGHAEAVRVGPVLSRLGAGKPVTGPVGLRANVRTQGRSADALLRGLAGHGSFTGTLTLAPGTAASVRERAGAPAGLLDAFAGRGAALSGTVDIDGGVLATDDTTLSGHGARASLTGRVDLPAWRMDATVSVTRAGDGAEPVLTARLSGPLDAPSVSLNAAAPKRRPDPLPAAGTSEPEPPATSAPDEPAIGRIAPPEPAPQQPAVGVVEPDRPEPERPAIGPVSQPDGGDGQRGAAPPPAPQKPAIPDREAAPAPKDPASGNAESIIEGVIEEYGQ